MIGHIGPTSVRTLEKGSVEGTHHQALCAALSCCLLMAWCISRDLPSLVMTSLQHGATANTSCMALLWCGNFN